MRDGSLEMAVVTLAPHPVEQLHVVELWRDRLCFVCANDHPLATQAQQSTLSLADLCEHNCVMPGPRPYRLADRPAL